MTHDAPLNETAIEEAGRQLKLGNAEALRRALGLLGPPVQARLSRAFRPGLNEEDIQDVLAIALARLWQNRDDYDPGRGSLLTWFYLLARDCGGPGVVGQRGSGAEEAAAGPASGPTP